MKYNYNGHLTFEERIKEICCEIKKIYPKLDTKMMLKIATLDGIINDSEYNPKNEFKRLYNILYVINNNESYISTYNDVLMDIEKIYNKFFKDKDCYEKELMNDIYNHRILQLYNVNK